jgi:hypothetical protein
VTDVVVVDTNVPLTANGAATASAACMRACVDSLIELMSDRRRIAVDDGWRIIREYMNKLRPSGQPGLGDRFLKWVLTNRENPYRCEQVTIHPRGNAEDFEEFPRVPGLEGFDPSDRKFVAVANAHPGRPPILQGVDSKWWGWREALATAGIPVSFLCPAEVQAAYEAKFPRSGARERGARRG